MQDRVPLYPGRVKLVPVAGQKNTYDMTRADQPTQEGDPLNKATLWSDVTAALFGLGVDSVPDDGFAYLGKYAQHWWKRRTSLGFGEWEYVQSSDRHTYPDSGKQYGYEYEYMGIPFENAVSAPSIERGTYAGTGKRGYANKNSLSFSFSPAFLIITRDDNSPTPSDGFWFDSAIWTNGAKKFYVGRADNEGKNTVELKNNTVSWYADGSASIQLNESGATYHYIAIG